MQNMKIIVDSREKRPWKFQGHLTETESMRTGDYSIKGYQHVMAVERKSFSDYFNCCTRSAAARLKFSKQLQRLAEMPFSIVVVEGSLGRMSGSLMSSIGRRSRWGAPSARELHETMLKQTAKLTAEYGVPILFMDNRNEAEDFALVWLTHVYERLLELWSNPSASPIVHWPATSRAGETISFTTCKEYDPSETSERSPKEK